jgi:hypothetical protein
MRFRRGEVRNCCAKDEARGWHEFDGEGKVMFT